MSAAGSHSRLQWYFNRLASMSPPEILHRLKESGLRQVSKRRPYGWKRFEGAALAFPVLPGLRASLVENATPAFRQALDDATRNLLDGRFSALGVAWPERAPEDLFPPSVWRLDPVTTGLWPGTEQFTFNIKYRHERTLGDIKYVWEFNRLQFLQPLAARVALEGDPRALAAVEAALTSWIDANPPFQGLGWNSGIELALRAVSIVLVAAFCGEQLSAATRARLGTVLNAHLYWLRRYPSRFSSANNHCIAEHMAIFVIATLLTQPPGTARIARDARKALEHELLLQILSDGTPAEQSPTYGAFSVEMLLLSAGVAREIGQPFSAAVHTRLERFSDFIARLAEDDGRVPAIGDDDEGRVLTLCGAREDTYAVSVAAIAGPLSAPLVQRRSGAPELREAVFPPRAPGGAAKQGLKTFAEGGYSVVRDNRLGHEIKLVVDHGPLGYLSIAAHGHADANAILLSIDGKPVLVDPGTYLYHSGGAWRDWFRGTRAHNTLAVESADQSVISGPFNWSEKAQSYPVSVKDGPDWSITASHDGYQKRFGVVHRRILKASPTGFNVYDTLVPYTANHRVEVNFQCGPDIDVTQQGDGWSLTREGSEFMTITFGGEGRTFAVKGAALGEGGWISPRFGEKVPAYRITWQGTLPRDGLITQFTLIR
ncbi:heparinase II/III-family protein [Xanthobacter autotrophicus]|uniref:heparinase II/III family protein n=1 Tax=Xanthobacter autotrophicus TaxID=280 RepID=UPI003728CCD9